MGNSSSVGGTVLMIEPMRKIRRYVIAAATGLGVLLVLEAVQIGLVVVMLAKG